METGQSASGETSAQKGDGALSAEERLNAKLQAMEENSEAQVEEAQISSVDVESGEPVAELEVPHANGVVAEEEIPRDLATEATAQSVDITRGEVSATTVARMMGLATVNELSMLEGKIDLLSSRVNSVTAKLERIQTVLSQVPTGTDLDRIDINIGSLRTLIKESLELLTTAAEKEKATGDEGTLKKATVMSSEDSGSES